MIILVIILGGSATLTWSGSQLPGSKKMFNPQPEPPVDPKLIDPGDEYPSDHERILVLSDGRKLVMVKRSNRQTAYIIQKDATLELADGVFTLQNGQKLTVKRGIIFDQNN